MAHIFLVEDNAESSLLVKKCLEPIHTVEVATSIAEARNLFSAEKTDFILLDISLPDGSGLELLEEFNRSLEHKPPIILLSAKDTLADIVLGLNSGADDYITKPFHSAELKARVEACLRRVIEHEPTTTGLESPLPPGLELDMDFQRAYLTIDGSKTDINLTPIEFRILYYFIQNPNQPLTRFRIATNVWKDRSHFEPKGIDSHISHLRKKLGPLGELIKTVVGLGYAYRPSE